MKHTFKGWILDKEQIISLQDLRKNVEMINDSFSMPLLDKYKIYYFSSTSGNDNNDGLSIYSAKSSIKEVNRIIHQEDMVAILFKRGDTFIGNLIIDGSYTNEKLPLYISSYGEREEYPKITSDGSVIRIFSSNVLISGLEIYGENALRGIHITPKEKGILKNIYILNNYVHDINFHYQNKIDTVYVSPLKLNVESISPELDKNNNREGPYFYRYHGGIIAHNEIGPSYFENIHIKGNIIKNVARTGITLYNKWTNKPGVGYGYNKFIGYDKPNNIETGEGYFESNNIFCSDNYLECTGGDGIVISSAKNVIVKNNISYFANYLGRKGYWNASIWVYNVNNCLFSNNEAGYTYKCYGSEDAQGFDIDNCCQNVLFENNISHHNQGGGLLICNLETTFDDSGEKETGRWFNNYITNNYFYKNGIESDNSRSAFLTIARETDYAYFLNNIIVINSNIKEQNIINTEDESTYCYRLYFKNNIFLTDKDNKSKLSIKMMKDSLFEHNYFKNVTPFGDKYIILDSSNYLDINLIFEEKNIFFRRQKAFLRKETFHNAIRRNFACEK